MSEKSPLLLLALAACISLASCATDDPAVPAPVAPEALVAPAPETPPTAAPAPAVPAPAAPAPAAAVPVVRAPEPAPPPAAVPVPERIALRLDLRPGLELPYVMENHTVQRMDMGGMQMETVMDQRSEVTYRVGAADAEGNSEVAVDVGRISGKVSNPMMGEMEFASDQSDQPQEGGNPMMEMMIKPLTMLAGKTFTMTLTPAGEVVAVRGVKEIAEEAFASMPGGEAMAGMMGGFTDDAAKQQWGGFFGNMPKEPLAVGATWTDAMGLDLQGIPGKTQTTYRVTEADDDVVVIASEGTVSVDVAAVAKKAAAAAEAAGQPPEAAPQMSGGNGTTKATTRYSRKDGFPLHAETETSMAMTISAMGQEIPIQQTVKTTLERTANTTR